MKHLLKSFLCVLLSAFLSTPTHALARDLKTMHFENDVPRPGQVSISGADSEQVVLYCTDISAGCKALREHLRKTGVSFVDKNPQTDPQAGAEFDALGGKGVPLVVFKQRLMHGYFPASFDKLYAKYHKGMEAKAAAATPATSPDSDKVGPPTAARVSSQDSSPNAVELVEPSAIEAFVQTNPRVVVQFTSPDTGCRPCIDAYAGFNAAADSHKGNVKFIRVQWSPWSQMPKEVAKYNLLAVPARVAFLNGVVIHKLLGGAGENEIRAWVSKVFAQAN